MKALTLLIATLLIGPTVHAKEGPREVLLEVQMGHHSSEKIEFYRTSFDGVKATVMSYSVDGRVRAQHPVPAEIFNKYLAKFNSTLPARARRQLAAIAPCGSLLIVGKDKMVCLDGASANMKSQLGRWWKDVRELLF